MKKILIIVQKRGNERYSHGNLIQEYIDMKKSQGYSVELIADTTGVMQSLLEEEELWGKEITSAQAEVMFEINRYELVIYLPQEASSLKDAPVYDPDKLDKNMIFYNIGNMIIVNSIDPQNELSSDEAIKSPGSDIFSDEPEVDEEKPSEDDFVFENRKQAEEMIEEVFSAHDLPTDKDDFEQPETQTVFEQKPLRPEGEGLQENHDISENPENEGKSDNSYLQNLSREELFEETGQQNQIKKELNEDGLALEDPYSDLSVKSALLQKNADGNADWENISAHAVISISEDGIDIIPQVSEKHRHENEIKKVSYEDTSSRDAETKEELAENIFSEALPQKPSIVRRLWLICPWLLMVLMALLKYENVAWIPFVVSVVGLFSAIISKKSRRQSKTPEWLSVFLALIALIVNFLHAEWMMVIAMPISIMAIVLFIIAGFVDWDH